MVCSLHPSRPGYAAETSESLRTSTDGRPRRRWDASACPRGAQERQDGDECTWRRILHQRPQPQHHTLRWHRWAMKAPASHAGVCPPGIRVAQAERHRQGVHRPSQRRLGRPDRIPAGVRLTRPYCPFERAASTRRKHTMHTRPGPRRPPLHKQRPFVYKRLRVLESDDWVDQAATVTLFPAVALARFFSLGQRFRGPGFGTPQPRGP